MTKKLRFGNETNEIIQERCDSFSPENQKNLEE